MRLAEHLAGYRRFLQRGQIVLTGSPLPLYRVADGDEITVSCNKSDTVVALFDIYAVTLRLLPTSVPIKGIGPWTLSVFQIMVLREPDELPIGDVGLERAIVSLYGGSACAVELGDNWRPFRSVACWYLWRTLGNEQLG